MEYEYINGEAQKREEIRILSVQHQGNANESK
jgi:hypothetical protein